MKQGDYENGIFFNDQQKEIKSQIITELLNLFYIRIHEYEYLFKGKYDLSTIHITVPMTFFREVFSNMMKDVEPRMSLNEIENSLRPMMKELMIDILRVIKEERKNSDH